MVQNILKPMSSHIYGTARTEALQVQSDNIPALTDQESATVATIAASSAGSTVVLAATNVRNGAVFLNGGTTTCYLTFGPTSTTSTYTVSIASNATYTLPVPVYDGTISAIWAATPSGNLQVTSY